MIVLRGRKWPREKRMMKRDWPIADCPLTVGEVTIAAVPALDKLAGKAVSAAC